MVMRKSLAAAILQPFTANAAKFLGGVDALHSHRGLADWETVQVIW
jgi:hypothetical protein